MDEGIAMAKYLRKPVLMPFMLTLDARGMV